MRPGKMKMQQSTGTFQATAKDAKEAAQRSGAFQAAGGTDSEMEKKQKKAKIA